MSDAMDFLNKLNTFLTKVFFPLTEFEDEEDIQILFREVGIDISSAPTLFADLAALIGEIANIVDDFENSDENSDNQDLHKSVFEIVISSIKTIKRLSEETENLSSFSANDIFKSLLDYLLCHHLQEEIPVLYEVFILCEIIEATEKTLVIGGEEHTYQERKIDYSGALAFVTDPLQKLKEIYGWDSDNVNVPLLIDRVSNLLTACDVISDFGAISSNINSVLGANTKSFDINNFTDYSGTVLETKIPLGEGLDGFTIQLYPLYSADGTKCDGIAVGVGFSGEINIVIPLSDNLQIKLTTNASVNNGAGMAFRKNSPITFFQNLFTGDGSQLSGSLDFSFLGKLVYGSEDERTILLGCSNGSSISTASMDLSIGVLKSGSKPLDIFVELHLSNCEIVIAAKDGDSFISKLLGDEEIKASFDFGIGWSSLTGIYFSGSAALEVTIPLHAKLGSILIESIFLGVQLDGENIDISIASSFGAKLGPINASINRIGLIVPFAFPPQRNGNLGPIDIQTPQFLPPIGAGLAIDTGPVTGGGYVEFDNENKRYAGILQLAFGEIGLIAIGLITTRMPDGSKDFSMLVIIGVEFDPPISLPYNFNLSGVGGLLGIKRSMNVDYLREGLKQGTLDSVLFPQDPILNAPRIISDLRAGFPPTKDRYIIGPMAIIGWGNPQIIRAEIGIFIEIPSPVRIAILGQITAQLPNAEEDTETIVVIHLDILGVLDFEKQSFSLDATIYDSRILQFALSGDMAMRLYWGDPPFFLTSFGGFNPKFKVRPGTPVLRRMMLSIGKGDNPRLSLECYMALTPNTTQFGAKLELTARKAGFKVHGYLYFHALFIFSPFSFVIDMGAGVEVYKGSRCLLCISLDFTLSGPTPWRAKGTGKFKILLLKVKVRFDKSWGKRQSPSLPATDPWWLLKDALENRGNWKGLLPGEKEQVIRLKKIEDAEGTVAVHPKGRLEISQNVLPFNLILQKFGNGPISGDDDYRITELQINEESVDIGKLNYVKDYFAKAQFIKMSDTEKLSRPSFEKEDANILIGSDDIRMGSAVKYDLEYETEVIDENKVTHSLELTPVLWKFGGVLLHGRAKRESSPAAKKFRRSGLEPLVGLADEQYRVVTKDGLNSVTEVVASYSQAQYMMQGFLESHPEQDGNIQIISE